MESVGKLSQNGMWKVKAKLFPRPRDPPMAKLDQSGTLITAHGSLKQLYLQTYMQRLENRKIKKDYEDIFTLKTKLWEERFRNVKKKKSQQWNMTDLDKVIATLK